MRAVITLGVVVVAAWLDGCSSREPRAPDSGGAHQGPGDRGTIASDSMSTLRTPDSVKATTSAGARTVVPTETEAIRGAGGTVTRVDDTLRIALTTGVVVTRINEEHEDFAYDYRYRARIVGAGGRAFHLLHMAGLDTSYFQLLDVRTGDSLNVNGLPVLSPDSARFLTSVGGE